MDRCKLDKVNKKVNAMYFFGKKCNTSECVFEDNMAEQPLICPVTGLLWC